MSNPYAPPSAIDPDEEPATTEHEKRGMPGTDLIIGWATVLLVNLAMPVLFATYMLNTSAWFGVVIGVVVIGGTGWWAMKKSTAVRRPLLIGGGVIALSQFVPILQLICGGLALEFTRWAGLMIDSDQSPISEVLSPVGAFLATMLTGGQLAMVALLIGSVINIFLRPKSGRQ